MRVVPITEAEAIIETYFNVRETMDEQKRCRLQQYRVSTDDACSGSGVSDCWHAVAVNLQTPGAYLEMERDCDLLIGGYDTLRLFAAIPSTMQLRITATIDGEGRVLTDGVCGTDNTGEYDMPIAGERMTRFALRLTLTGENPAQATLSWVGLENSVRQAELEARPSPYDASWPELLRDTDVFEPQLGIYFDNDGLEAIRRKVKGGYLSDAYQQLHHTAVSGLSCEPEKQIGTFMGLRDRRWLLTRDMNKRDFSGLMEIMAFVGIVERNADMCRMAVRMALSAAHCTYWTESFMGVFPGSTWHHCSFTEEVYCRGCSAVLDWAGAFLTPYGKAVIQDAIMMKGLPRIEANFRTSEYIRSMNQGIVFSGGRILGMLALVQTYPRYRVLLEEAERDLLEMVERYIRPDGGCDEGPGYWRYSMNNALPLLYVLARYHGKTLQEYAPASVHRCGAYACQMLSVQAPGGSTICVNDSSMTQGALGPQFEPSLPAMLWKITGEERYLRLLSDTLYGLKGRVRIDLILFMAAPEALPQTPQYVPFGLDTMNVVGQTHIVRQGRHRITNLHLTSGAASAGHGHEDRGGFVLETDCETLALDRGSAWYAHPESAMMQRAVYHNLLVPERDGACFRQTITKDAVVGDTRFENGVFCYTTETQNVWREQPFTLAARRVVSPTPEIVVFADEVECTEPTTLHFTVNSSGEAVPEAGGMRILGEENDLFLCPLNWTADAMNSEVRGVDSKLRPVQLTRLTATNATKAHLLTALVILEKEEAAPMLQNGVLSVGDAVLTALAEPRSVTVRCTQNGATRTAVYKDRQWVID